MRQIIRTKKTLCNPTTSFVPNGPSVPLTPDDHGQGNVGRRAPTLDLDGLESDTIIAQMLCTLLGHR